ncbi:AbpA [Verticillium alfalfae VaMs.102]|uniref:Class E vacuolar protein-sorting machinery protein HSE1 n=1 Tax=Verticillium alfalfae (strain VaMs.102 / ATCC MYA-4576 / FGSC 10136) TaxID=526221 RepID=C9SIH9_VERA1|nr:AbpA [Verticillium alfalfae VaMs.102]EEY18752.1 AbpA [Verticillium alfalfae VaMs.102]
MASLNLSSNGQSIKSSYQGVINGPAPSSSSPTYAQWALFSVQAPLANAFQDSGSKESILKVQSTGDGELAELIEDFSEGRIQFAFVKVKDPNSGLPKYALIAWCGGGVPERTKGYFTTHTAAVSKILHGYHVQITARSDSDLEPESIVKKIADASGAKYSAGASSTASPAPPPVASKPVFNPTASSASNPLVAARNRRGGNVDEDGWGEDAPQVSRSQLEKVDSAYKPTKVNMAELTNQRQEPSRFKASSKQEDDGDVVRGGYQPIGKVDIAAIRAAAKNKVDDRPTTVKGAYEPIGKVDIAAIRAKAQQKPSEAEPAARPAAADDEQDNQPKSLAERSAAFSQSSQPERLTSLPKPKVANKFGGAASFGGTKAPTPGGLGLLGPTAATPTAAPVGAASRTFADQGGKTPAQLWAEKKAREGGGAPAAAPIAAQNNGAAAAPLGVQKSGEWKSGYSGKSWGAVQTGEYGRGIAGKISQENTGEPEQSKDRSVEQPESPAGGVGALKDRFKDTAPIGFGAPPPPVPSFSRDEPEEEEPREASPPPPPPSDSRPTGGFALPGLPSRPPPPTDEEEDDEPPAPPRPAERPAEPQQSYDEPEHSPVRVAVPVARGPEPEIEPAEAHAPRPIPTQEIERELPREQDLPEEAPDVGRGAAAAVAQQELREANIPAAQPPAGAQAGGQRALIHSARANTSPTLKWSTRTGGWAPTRRARAASSLATTSSSSRTSPNRRRLRLPLLPRAHSRPPRPPKPSRSRSRRQQAAQDTALFDYEAAEDNELGFRENDKITDIEFPDEDWWFGHLRGKQGLFPANYVELDQ